MQPAAGSETPAGGGDTTGNGTGGGSMPSELVAPESAAALADDVEVTFTEAGSLGIKFVHNPHATVVQIRAINPGTQAERHTVLQPGMVLRDVGGTSVVGRSYKDTIDIIKAQGRPLACRFGPVQPLPDAIVPVGGNTPTASQAAAAAAAPAALVGRAAPDAVGPAVDTLAVPLAATEHDPAEESPDKHAVEPTRYEAAFVEDDDDTELANSDATGGDTTGNGTGGGSMPSELVAPESAAALADDVEVTFTEAGSLGIKFVHNPHATVVQIRAINPGTQAERHTVLQPGMVLRDVGGTSVVGRSYKDTIDIIKAQGRPLACRFGPVQPLPDAIVPVGGNTPTASQAAAAAAAPAALVGRAAPDAVGPAADTLAVPLAATEHDPAEESPDKHAVEPTRYEAAFVEDDDDTELANSDATGGDTTGNGTGGGSMPSELVAPESAAALADDVEVTFTEAGSLGIKFVHNPHATVVQIRAINPGTQAERHTVLQPGMVLRDVGGTSVVGRSYKDTIDIIKAQGRPLACRFGPVQPLPDAIVPVGGNTPTASQAAAAAAAPPGTERLTPTTVSGLLRVSLFKSPSGFGFSLSDSCEVLHVGGDAAAQQVPLHSRIIEVNGIPVTTKIQIKEVVTKLRPEVNPVPFVLALDSALPVERAATAPAAATDPKGSPAGTTKMKKPMKRPARGATQARARRDSVALLSKSGFDGAAQMNILSTFERSRLDPTRWEEALTKLGVEKLTELAKAVEAEQQRESRSPLGNEDATQKEERVSEQGAQQQVKMPLSLATTFEVEEGNTQQLRSQLFESPSPRRQASGRATEKVMQKPQGAGGRSRGAAMARRNSIAMMQGERGLDAFTAAGIIDTFTKAGMEPKRWESTLASMSAQQLKQLASVVRASAAEQLGQAAVDDIVAEAIPPSDYRQAPSTVAVTIAESGPLGCIFRTCFAGSQPVIAAITPGSAAARTDMCIGQALVKVEDKSVVGMKFSDIVEIVRSTHRPVRLTLARPVIVTFGSGALGLKMQNDYRGGPARIKSIVPGSAAALQSTLRVGMVLVCINNVSVVGYSFQEAVDLVHRSSRPITLAFTQGPEAAEGVPRPALGSQNGPLRSNCEHSDIRVRVCTWNCGNAAPSGFLRDIFHVKPSNAASAQEDVVVLGLQESVFNAGGGEELKTSSKAKQIMKGSVGLKSPLDEFWVGAASEALGDGWSMVSMATLGEMRLLAFARSALVSAISEVETAQEACGIGGVVGNKGGLVIKFKVNNTSLCFISCHLAAHEGEKKATKRNDNIREVLAGARVGPFKWMDAATQFDHTWFIGDLNYRVDLQQLDGVDRQQGLHVDEVIQKAMAGQFDVLQRADQLHRELSTKRVLVGFTEGRLNYAPTFKVEREPVLNYTRKRVPSYCDRILFRSLPGLSANQRQEWVQPVESAASSDHKPLVSSHSVRIRNATARRDSAPRLRITITGLHASGLTAMDANGKNDAYIKFLSPALRGTSNVPQTSVMKATVDPRWDNANVPKLLCSSAQLEDIRKEHLHLTIWDRDLGSADDLIGTGVVSLAACEDLGKPVKFGADVIRDGQIHGKVAGWVQISDLHQAASTPHVEENPDAGWYEPGPPLQVDANHSALLIRVATYNCGNVKPTDLDKVVRSHPVGAQPTEPDVFVLGLQESVFNAGGGEELKTSSKAKQIMKGSVGLKSPLDEFWVGAASEALGDGWSMVSMATLGEMRLLAFARSALVSAISEVETAQEACGIGGVVGNKGGLVIKFKVNNTSLCFISCHLAAHEGEKKATKRNDNIREVLAGARVGPFKWMDAATQFDHTWFIGDLNYRVDLQQLDGVDRQQGLHVDEVIQKAMAGQFDVLQRADQLHRELSTKRVLVGFTEGRLNYAPTFKVEREPVLNYTRKRVPSYCDRILFRSLPGLSANQRQEWVQPVESAASSDHKPVAALHSVLVEKIPSKAASPSVRVAVTVSNLHGSKLTPMDANGKSDPYVVFDSRGCWKPNKKYKTKVLKSTLDPRWSHKDVPTVEGTCNDEESLRRSHLFLSVWDYDRGSADDLIGTCVLPLSQPWNTGAAVDFSAEILNNGKIHGHIAGRIQCHSSLSTVGLLDDDENASDGNDDV